MKNLKRKRMLILKVIFAILIICSIIFIIICTLKNNDNSKYLTEELIEEAQQDYEEVQNNMNQKLLEKNQIAPKNYNLIIRLYDGDIDSSEMFESIYNLVYVYIPNIYEELYGASQSQIEEYYENNNSIMEELGLETLNEFNDFLNNVVLIVGKQSYITSIFGEDMYDEGEYSVVSLSIEYSEITINFNMEIINKITENSPNIKYVVQ